MRIKSLEAFHNVYKSKSISIAARLLNVSQPAISASIKRYEKELGFKLFIRRTGKLVPTREANFIYHQTSTLFRQIDSFDEVMKRIKLGVGEVLRLAITPYINDIFMPSLLKQINSRLSELIVQPLIVEWHNAELVSNSQYSDLIIIEAIDNLSLRPNEVFGSSDVVCIVGEGSALFNKDIISKEDLSEIKFIIPASEVSPIGNVIMKAIEGISLNNIIQLCDRISMSSFLDSKQTEVAIVDRLSANYIIRALPAKHKIIPFYKNISINYALKQCGVYSLSKKNEAIKDFLEAVIKANLS